MLAFLSMITGEPLDHQRERRWPNHTDPAAQGDEGLQVKLAPHEEDPEVCLFPPLHFVFLLCLACYTPDVASLVRRHGGRCAAGAIL